MNRPRMSFPGETTHVTTADVLVIAKAAKAADMTTTLAMFSSLTFACEMFKAIDVPLEGAGPAEEVWLEYCRQAFKIARNNTIEVAQLGDC